MPVEGEIAFRDKRQKKDDSYLVYIHFLFSAMSVMFSVFFC